MSKPQTPSPWRIIQPVRAQIRRAMLFSAAIVLGTAALLLMAHILRGLLNNRADWFSAALFAALTLTAFFLRGYAFRVSHLAAFRLETILRGELADRLARVSLGYLHDRGAAALTKVMQDDVHGLHAFVADSTPLYARAYAAPLISFAVLLFVDWRLAMVAAAVLAAGMVVFSLTMRNAGESTAAYNAAREQVNTAVVEFVQAMPVVRIFDCGETSFRRYQRALDNYLAMLIDWYRSVGGSARTGMLMLNPAPTLIALLWAGFYWFCADALPFGTWLAVLLLGTGMAEALTPYISLYHLIGQGKISAERIIEVLDAPVLPVLAPPQTPQDAGVCFEHVSFRYLGRSKNALTDISFTAPAGSLTALVGGSGAGKTTLIRLIMRYADPQQGRILISCSDIRALTQEDLMRQISVVFQDVYLFDDTIANNIRLGKADASDAEIEAAARTARCHDFIMAMPEGYQTRVGDIGGKLSGGEKQRISIACALLKNAPIIILDEPTAALDTESEVAVQQAIDALVQDKTVIVITHRLSTISGAQQIIVLSGGQVAESGTHSELLTQNGVYRRLWQAGGWEED